ncbi:MAG: hypothetical protein ACRD72_25540, partial [Candidatus Angelobacter sp.]
MVGNTQDEFSDIKQPYIVYAPPGSLDSVKYGCSNTTFLVTLNQDGTLNLMAVVNNAIQKGNFVYAADISKPVLGTQAVPGSGTTTSGDTCDLKSNGLTIAWLLCPSLEAADAGASNLMRLFEAQLPLCIDNYGVTCQTGADRNFTASGEAQLKTAWTIIKDLASAILVLVMLVMVFSQAIGGGPFDAYSVRKMLPRLAAAVILMQISWPLLAYAVDIVNDIGNGLAGLMYVPFGGAANLDFGSLLSNAGVGTGQGFFIGWFGAAAVLALGLAFLPTVLFGALVAALTLLVGYAVLVFRKILIIMLMILSPLALVIWILPGNSMQKFWKLWQDNFVKSLM